MRFGILQRYVLGEILRAFSLALLTITCIFVLLTVMTTAASIGLSPAEIGQLVPFMIPRSFPYTIPVSLLFAATVVYGRLASDNEVIAVKTAGVSAMVLIWPTLLLALILSVGLSIASLDAIPRSNAAAKKVIYRNLEDFFYKMLRKERSFDAKNWPFLINVVDVQGRKMIKPIFKQRAKKPAVPAALPGGEADPGAGPAFDMVIRAKTAELRFDFDAKPPKVRVFFEDANIIQAGVEPNEGNIRHKWIEFEVADNTFNNNTTMVEEMTVAEMWEKKADYLEKIELERRRQAAAAAMFIGAGQLDRVSWRGMQAAFSDYDYWNTEIHKFDTEFWMRLAMAWGTLCFVFLGAPVGILFARRDFLSAFISCFMPIIMLYYPLMLFGLNLGKEGLVPASTVWIANGVLWVVAWFWAYPPVRQH